MGEAYRAVVGREMCAGTVYGFPMALQYAPLGYRWSMGQAWISVSIFGSMGTRQLPTAGPRCEGVATCTGWACFQHAAKHQSSQSCLNTNLAIATP